MNDKQRLVRVELEFDDGETVRLEGPEAEVWNAAVKRQAVMASVRCGDYFPKLNWKLLAAGTKEEA